MPVDGRSHVTLHGFGEFAAVYKRLIDVAREMEAPIDFSIVLPTSVHRDFLRTSLPDDRIYCLEDEIGRYDEMPLDLSELANYHGNIHRDVDADKRDPIRRPGARQTRQALAVYRAYRDLLRRWNPDHILFAHVESFEQKMMTSLSQELGIPISVPIDARILGGSFMCTDVYETLPNMPFDPEPHRERAAETVRRFRDRQLKVVNYPFPDEERGEQFPRNIRPLQVRTADFIRRSVRDLKRFEPDTFQAAFMNNLPFVRDAVYGLRRRRAMTWYDTESMDDLPPKFIYFPLQYTPESSINTPAPYFVDQMRVVDAIRHAMPSDHMLVVKDHPAVMRERKKELLDKIRRRSGVTVMSAAVSGRALIERAALTISVTGTSTMEAFLLGKPALTLGGMFMSRYMGGVAPISELETRIRDAIGHPPSDEKVVSAVADILALKRPFSIFVLQLPGDPVYNRTNIVNMLAALREAIAMRPKVRT